MNNFKKLSAIISLSAKK